jgi:hypothetical protein
LLVNQDAEGCPFLATLLCLVAGHGSQPKQLIVHKKLCALALHFSLDLGRGLASAGFFFASFFEMLPELLFKATELCWLEMLVD